MGLLDNLERGLEKVVRSAFSAGGSRKVKPVEIANALRLAMDDDALVVTEGRTLVPNVFTIAFSPDNFEQIRHWGSALAEELCDDAIRHATEQGYTLQGPVRVTFVEDDEVRAGKLDIETSTERAERSEPAEHAPPAARPAPTHHRPETAPPPPPADHAAPLQPVLEISGRRYALHSDSIVLGRATDADITLEDPGVSRRHMEIMTRGSTVTAIDLGSTNGFLLNGRKVQGSASLRHGDVLTVGRERLIFRMLPHQSHHAGGRT